MSNDIDNLNELADVEVGYQGEDYEPSTAFAQPPPAGEYTFMRVADQESDYKDGAGKTEKGTAFFWSNFKVQVQGGQYDGRTAFFGVNTFTFDRKNSSADDFIRASKSPKRPRTIAEYKRDLPTIVGPFNAVTSWEWNCRDCQLTFLKGYIGAKAPKKYTGPKFEVKLTETKNSKGQAVKVAHHIQQCPQCEQQVGARMVAQRFVVPTAATGKVATVSKPAVVVEGLAPAAG